MATEPTHLVRDTGERGTESGRRDFSKVNGNNTPSAEDAKLYKANGVSSRVPYNELFQLDSTDTRSGMLVQRHPLVSSARQE